MQTKILAHRGASMLFPENTEMAFAAAIELGADGVELDCQRTKDGVVVVFHDETLQRLTDHQGYLHTLNFAELQQLRIITKNRDATASIPTLESILLLFKSKSNSAIINIELKNSIIFDCGLEAEVLAIVKRTGMLERVVFSSFNHYSLRWFVEKGLAHQTAALFDGNVYQPWLVTKAMGVNAIHPLATNLLIPNWFEEAKAHTLVVRPWTIDQPDHIAFALNLGMDAIITNDPVHALTIRESLAKSSQS